MKCSLGISNFLEEICSLSHSIVFLYFFAMITEEVFFISPSYSLKISIQMQSKSTIRFALWPSTKKKKKIDDPCFWLLKSILSKC